MRQGATRHDAVQFGHSLRGSKFRTALFDTGYYATLPRPASRKLLFSSHHQSILPPVQRTSPLVGNANDTASRAGASVASLLALFVVTLAEVISAGVDDDGAAENALRADQLDELVGDAALAVALAVGLEVSEVTNVALTVGWRAVGLALRVDWKMSMAVTIDSRKDGQHTVGTGAGAAVGVVAKGVDMHATLSVGVVAGDVP